MPRAVPLLTRQSLWAAAQQGLSVSQLAQRFDLSERTVRHLLKSIRDKQGQVEGPAYHRPGAGSRFPAPLFARARSLKESHPSWGAGYILELLALDTPKADLPCVRTLQDWFAGLGHRAAPAGRRRQNYCRASRCHQRWQMDAAEQMKLLDGSWACWLRVTDEFSGAVLGTELFPPQPLQHGAAAARARANAAMV